MADAKDPKLTVKEKIRFLTEKPSSKDFGKTRAEWKASKDKDKGK
jgi:hypothetical protein